MERHIAETIEHFANGKDTRSGFAQTKERAMAHAFWLESEVMRLREDNRKLEDMLAVGLPSITASWKDTPLSVEAPNDIRALDWRLESKHWRTMLKPFHSLATPVAWLRIRRITYRQLLKAVRLEFENTFPRSIGQN